MIEEIDTLPREVQAVAFEQATEWLASSQSPDIKPRLKAAQKKIAAQRQSKPQPVDLRDVLFNKRHDLQAEVLRFEHELIGETLAKVNGKVTHAAKILGIGYQTLAHMIERKHPDLLTKADASAPQTTKERTKVQERQRLIHVAAH